MNRNFCLDLQAGALDGRFVNATPFKKCSQEGGDGKDFAKTGGNDGSADMFGKQMNAHGFNHHGTEVMYSGVLGTEFVCEIYFGVVYYQRLRHMVSDKYQVHTLQFVDEFNSTNSIPFKT
jgi:DNA-directed RNA polymerase I subunit RPA2